MQLLVIHKKKPSSLANQPCIQKNMMCSVLCRLKVPLLRAWVVFIEYRTYRTYLPYIYVYMNIYFRNWILHITDIPYVSIPIASVTTIFKIEPALHRIHEDKLKWELLLHNFSQCYVCCPLCILLLLLKRFNICLLILYLTKPNK